MQKIGRTVQWLLTLSALGFYFGYITLLATWWLLAAILNPMMFLPYASGAITFFTFIRAKYSQFKTLAKEGERAILEYLKVDFEEVIANTIKKLFENIEGASYDIAKKAKNALSSVEFQTATRFLVKAGVVDEKHINFLKDKILKANARALVQAGAGAVLDPTSLLDGLEELSNTLVKI